MSSTMRVWGAIALAVRVALITQFGALVLGFLQRRHEFNQNSSDEWHRNLRWAADHVANGDEQAVLLGIHALDALDDKGHLKQDDRDLIDAILDAILLSTTELEDFSNLSGDDDQTKETYDESLTKTPENEGGCLE